jgi:glycosyltransferase involved in cell wall biosynthesis
VSRSVPRRIAFCITDLDAGGAERALVQIVTGLSREDWTCKVFCLSGEGELVAPLTAAGIPVECLGATSGWSVGVVGRLASGLRRWGPEVLQTFLFHANLAGRLAAWRTGTPIVVCGLRVAERDGPWRMRLDRWTQRLVTHNVAVSQGVADFSVGEVGLDPRKVSVIPNGIDGERFRRAAPLDLTRFGIPAGARVITFIGRLHPQKDPELLLNAALPLLRQHPEVHLLFAGEGPLREQLEERRCHESPADRVHFIGQCREVPELLRASMVCVLPSRWEGMPNVVLEAMASGCPVIASNVEGSRELIEPNVTGRLFPAGDAAALTGELAWVLEHPAAARVLAETAQTTERMTFEWSRVVTQYDRLYRGLLEPMAIVDNSGGS